VQVLHSWALSHVERLTLPDGDTVVFKTAAEPFTHEDAALAGARQAGVPVPRVLAATRAAATLGMLLQDLGPSLRVPDEDDGVAAAVHLHSAAVPDFLTRTDTTWLAGLPHRAVRTLNTLREQGRWAGTDDITTTLHMLAQAAPARAEGTMLRPYGWVHSEFHPTSLIIAEGRVYALDLARAFHGPGLLDLVSWHGTTETADPDRVRSFLERYVQAGGPREALHDRGGLRAQVWALGWHRVWIVEWYLAQAVRWIANPDDDPVYERVVRSHVHEAAQLLQV
jgi:hypothetical protein